MKDKSEIFGSLVLSSLLTYIRCAARVLVIVFTLKHVYCLEFANNRFCVWFTFHLVNNRIFTWCIPHFIFFIVSKSFFYEKNKWMEIWERKIKQVIKFKFIYKIMKVHNKTTPLILALFILTFIKSNFIATFLLYVHLSTIFH